MSSVTIRRAPFAIALALGPAGCGGAPTGTFHHDTAHFERSLSARAGVRASVEAAEKAAVTLEVRSDGVAVLRSNVAATQRYRWRSFGGDLTFEPLEAPATQPALTACAVVSADALLCEVMGYSWRFRR